MYCITKTKPTDSEACNTEACEFIWITGEWTEVTEYLPFPLPAALYCILVTEEHLGSPVLNAVKFNKFHVRFLKTLKAVNCVFEQNEAT